MTSEHAVSQAVDAIEGFLTMSMQTPAGGLTEEVIRELSFHVERARSFRQIASDSQRDLVLAQRYRDSLIRLRTRLGEIEALLTLQRDRISEEQARLAGVREWHRLLTRTQ